MMKTTHVTVAVSIARSRDYQRADYTLSKTIEIEDGDDVKSVIEGERNRLTKQVRDHVNSIIDVIAKDAAAGETR